MLARKLSNLLACGPAAVHRVTCASVYRVYRRASTIGLVVTTASRAPVLGQLSTLGLCMLSPCRPPAGLWRHTVPAGHRVHHLPSYRQPRHAGRHHQGEWSAAMWGYRQQATLCGSLARLRQLAGGGTSVPACARRGCHDGNCIPATAGDCMLVACPPLFCI